ncbi:MAG: hypothetical protein FD161_3071 [Limisphaerales bacterium]|nr:MAG: hypothetical protein FD161_3071 [Limisphaerales bacterium]KAG0508064.1 MAG: hypothetical protein E1N63_2778 [Limisphaerales bacterium]TXT52037.1 MAG: hypothetical protein FD140_1159 [Limisphaerales bacterium]
MKTNEVMECWSIGVMGFSTRTFLSNTPALQYSTTPLPR